MDYIFNAIVLNKILYALPVHFGYLTEDQKQMLQCVLYRANRRGFTSHCHDLDTLAESAQHDLFHHSRHSAHCLNHLYTAKLKPPGAMMLRARGHDFELPTVNFEFNKRNFIVRCLFQYVYGVYTDSVLSGWVVILKILHSGLLYNCSVMCILFMYCCKHVRQHVYNNTLLTYLLTYLQYAQKLYWTTLNQCNIV